MDIAKIIKDYLSLSKAKEVLFYLAMVWIPTNLFYSWRPSWAYLDGTFIDYWAPKLPGSVLLIIALTIVKLLNLYQTGRFSGYSVKRLALVVPRFRQFFLGNHYLILGIGVLIWVGWRQLLLPEPRPALFSLAIALTGPGLLIWFMNLETEFVRKNITPALLLATSIQAFLASYQFFWQRPLFPYWILGEPRFSAAYHLAASDYSSAWRILPYGSTPHPNVLGAWMIIGFFAAVGVNSRWLRWPLLAWFGLILAGTESITAWVSLLILWLMIKQRDRIRHLLLWGGDTKARYIWPALGVGIFTIAWHGVLWALGQFSWSDSPSITRRIDLLDSVLSRWPQWWLTGNGWLQHITLTRWAPILTFQGRFLQPVHSVLIVLLADLGFCAFLLLMLFCLIGYYYCSLVLWLIIGLLPIFSLDHFAVTTTSGQFMLVILTYFMFDIFEPFKPVTRRWTRQVSAGI